MVLPSLRLKHKYNVRTEILIFITASTKTRNTWCLRKPPRFIDYFLTPLFSMGSKSSASISKVLVLKSSRVIRQIKLCLSNVEKQLP